MKIECVKMHENAVLPIKEKGNLAFDLYVVVD